MADETFSFLAENCYAGQKRTARHKQVAFLNGEEVWKGPYKQDRIDTILARSKILKHWNTPLIVHPLRVEGEWIIFPNVAAEYPIEKSFFNEETYSDYKYWVAERSIVEKMNYVLLKNKWLYDIPDIIEACVHLWILGVGDVGMFNILVDQGKRVAYVIDYEEQSSNTRKGKYFYFSKDPAMKFNWHDNASKHYHEVSMRIKKLLDLSPDLAETINQAISLLGEHGKGKMIGEKEEERGGEEEEVREEERREEENVSITGKMAWHGMFGGTTTFSGYKMDVVKSGLQKYIRRSIANKALYCGFELFRLGSVGGGGAAVTNLFNRIKVIAAEDIGIADFSIAISVINLVNMETRDPKHLKSMIQMLSSAKKTRLGSHLCNVYKRPESRECSEKKGIIIDLDYSEEDDEFIEEHVKDPIFTSIVHPDLQSCALVFYKRLLDGDFNAVTWWGFFDHYATLDKAKIKMRNAYYDGSKWRKSTRPISILFDVLDLFVDKEAMNVLKWAYFTMTEVKPTEKKPHPRNENRCIFVLGVAAALHKIKFEKVTVIPDDDVGSLLNGRYKFEIDDYIVDKHTAEGSRRGKSRANFVSEGAVVHPEDMTYHYDDLYDVYMNCKDL